MSDTYDPYAGVDLAALLEAALAGERGDASSQLNFVNDYVGGIFDPAMGITQSMMGDPAAFDWSQLFEYDEPVIPEQPVVFRRQFERAAQSADEIERDIARMVDAGMSSSAIKNFLRTDPGMRAQFEVEEDGKVKLDTDRVKIYDDIASGLESEYDTWRNEMETYEQARQKAEQTPRTLKETDLVAKFRKAGIPLPSERPEYVTDDFSAGASNRRQQNDDYWGQRSALHGEASRLRRADPMDPDDVIPHMGDKFKNLARWGRSEEPALNRVMRWGSHERGRQEIEGRQNEVSSMVKGMGPAPQMDFAQVIRDRQGDGKAAQYAAAGRTPTGDAIISRILGQHLF